MPTPGVSLTNAKKVKKERRNGMKRRRIRRMDIPEWQKENCLLQRRRGMQNKIDRLYRAMSCLLLGLIVLLHSI